MSVLLSFLGIGRKNEDPNVSDVYKRIHHVLGDEGESCETALSVYALLQKYWGNISHVVIIGTHTSSWSVLLEEISDDCSELFIQVEQEIEQKHVDDSSLHAIEEILSRNWNVKVSCIAHTSQIESRTMQELHQLYQNVVFSFPEDTEEIIFDVTHGFRSMPLLMMTALEFREILFPERTKLHVLYVELQGEQAIAR
jgi:CRISPR-associated Csx2 family protein